MLNGRMIRILIRRGRVARRTELRTEERQFVSSSTSGTSKFPNGSRTNSPATLEWKNVAADGAKFVAGEFVSSLAQSLAFYTVLFGGTATAIYFFVPNPFTYAKRKTEEMKAGMKDKYGHIKEAAKSSTSEAKDSVTGKAQEVTGRIREAKEEQLASVNTKIDYAKNTLKSVGAMINIGKSSSSSSAPSSHTVDVSAVTNAGTDVNVEEIAQGEPVSTIFKNSELVDGTKNTKSG